MDGSVKDKPRRSTRKRGENKKVILARDERIWHLLAKGWTQVRIAAELDVDQSTVSRAINRVSARRLADLPAQVDQRRMEDHDGLCFMLDEALQSWEKSKVRRRKRKPTDPPAKPDDKDPDWITEECEGNPKYLESARSIRADLRKLWGLDAPQKHVVAATTVELTSDEHEQIAQMLGLSNVPMVARRQIVATEVAPSAGTEDDAMLAALDEISEAIGPGGQEGE